MTDAGEPSFRATQLDQAVRLTTTTAQSSASSPRANARQSSSTTCASSFADRSTLGQQAIEALDAVQLAVAARSR
jgi:hypothetical protein